MSRRTAAKRKTAPTDGASNTIPSRAAIAVAAVITSTGGVPQNTTACNLEPDGSYLRESCSCVISLYIDHYRPNTCEHCGSENKETVWVGILEDAKGVRGGDCPDIALINSEDTAGGRKGMVPYLQMIARNHGYQYCEVREYSLPDFDDYVPLFGGPLPELNAMR
jgi:hypothetical protein